MGIVQGEIVRDGNCPVGSRPGWELSRGEFSGVGTVAGWELSGWELSGGTRPGGTRPGGTRPGGTCPGGVVRSPLEI